jgi:hypothetical protein
MSRKTVTWIAVGALAAAAVIIAAIVAYHVGADHHSGRVAVGPFRRSFGTPTFVRTVRPFPVAEALVLLLIGGVVGAAIAVLARPGALAGHPAPAPPVDPRWRELDEWYRWAHGAPATPAAVQGPPRAAPTAPPAAPATPPATPSDPDIETPAPPSETA